MNAPLMPDPRFDAPSFRPLDATEAAAEWLALASGRWSVVDHFDQEGRRYLVAAPAQGDAPTLTPRERDVVSRVARGQCNKVIGYDLGLATSTVAGHLSSAMLKLGIRTRVELVARWNALPHASI